MTMKETESRPIVSPDGGDIVDTYIIAIHDKNSGKPVKVVCNGLNTHMMVLGTVAVIDGAIRKLTKSEDYVALSALCGLLNRAAEMTAELAYDMMPQEIKSEFYSRSGGEDNPEH